MYINPFLAGVIFTIGTEILIMFIAAVVATIGRVKRHDH